MLNELPEPERERFEEHLFDCAECSNRVRRAYLLVRGAEATLQHDLIRPGRSLPREKVLAFRASASSRHTWIAPLALAAAAILAVVSGYQNLREIPVLRNEAELAGTAESSPILLLSETRSETDRAVQPPGGGHVSLILTNIPGRVPAWYDCRLRDQTGKVVRQFRVRGIAEGDELELRLPTRGLTPEPYTLEVRGAPDTQGTADGSVSEYHFRLESR